MGTFKITRVVIDTNVIVSALLFGGMPGKLIPLWKNNIIQPLISGDIMDEYLRVLAYPKFELTENEINFLLYREILPFFKEIHVSREKRIIRKDPSDDKFIACAMDGHAVFIISGDNHLLDLGSCGSIEILSPSQALSRLKP
jgi:putative PIN family toxin of toxin-antitoxin system